MKNRLNKIFKILHKEKEIEVIVKKNKLSKNYKLTFDKKRLSGLVSIPKHISFNDGFSFAQENANWLIEQYNEMIVDFDDTDKILNHRDETMSKR